MKFLLLFPFTLLAADFSPAGELPPIAADPVTFLPGRTLFEPLAANDQEPRVGLRKEVGSSRMKLDIGSSLDLVEIDPSADHASAIRIGAEFFTYALTTSSRGLRLQVDAVDGFFGGHVVYVTRYERSSLALRLRLMHLSAHLLDGHYDTALKQWIGGRDPIPFTRDFGELVAAYAWDFERAMVRVYSGFSYAALVRPTEIRRFATLHGVEAYSLSFPGAVFGKPAEAYIADNVTLAGVPAWVATNTLEVGLKLGGWDRSGVRLYASYIHGLEIFSQYYNVRTDQWGLGFAFDLR